MAVEDFEQLRDRCAPNNNFGAQFQAFVAYLSARKFSAVAQRRSESGVRYSAKISRGAFAVSLEGVSVIGGRCVISADIHHPAIAGEVIIYECSVRPDAPAEFRRSGVHGGNHLRIEGNVSCTLAAPFDWVLARTPMSGPDQPDVTEQASGQEPQGQGTAIDRSKSDAD